MKYEDYSLEFTKLWTYWPKNGEVDINKMEDYFDLLQSMSIFRFKEACKAMKQSEKYFPQNPVAWINDYLEQKDSKHVPSNNFQNHGECKACKNSGWVDVGYNIVAYCQCLKGQYLKEYGNKADRTRTATFEECQRAARKFGFKEEFNFEPAGTTNN